MQSTHQRRERIFAPLAGKVSQTNTESQNTEITSETTASINHFEPSSDLNDSSEEALADEVKSELSKHLRIPYTYHNDKARMLAAIRHLTEWSYINRENFYSDLAYHSFHMAVDCLAEMACELSPHSYNKQLVSSGIEVINQINVCLSHDRTLWHFFEKAIKDYESGATKTEIINVRSYLKSVIWTSLLSYQVATNSSSAFCFGLPQV